MSQPRGGPMMTARCSEGVEVCDLRWDQVDFTGAVLPPGKERGPGLECFLVTRAVEALMARSYDGS
jgi:hypothetical protein